MPYVVFQHINWYILVSRHHDMVKIRNWNGRTTFWRCATPLWMDRCHIMTISQVDLCSGMSGSLLSDNVSNTQTVSTFGWHCSKLIETHVQVSISFISFYCDLLNKRAANNRLKFFELYSILHQNTAVHCWSYKFEKFFRIWLHISLYVVIEGGCFPVVAA